MGWVIEPTIVYSCPIVRNGLALSPHSHHYLELELESLKLISRPPVHCRNLIAFAGGRVKLKLNDNVTVAVAAGDRVHVVATAATHSRSLSRGVIGAAFLRRSRSYHI